MIELPFMVIPTELGTVTTGNEQANRPAINLGRFLWHGMVWRSTGNTDLWIKCDFGALKSIDFVAMLSANALSGTTIRVRLGTTEAEVDGTAPYDSTALAFISPAITREDGLYHSHLELDAPVSAQWLRIDIGGHTGDFEASALVVGLKRTPTRYYSKDFEFTVEDLGSSEFTRWGVPDDDDGLIFRALKFTLGWQTEAEYQDTFRPMIEALGKRRMVLACFDPQANAYRQAKTYFGRLTQSPAAIAGPKPGTYASEYRILSVV